MTGSLDRDFFLSAEHHLEMVLKNTSSSTTLNIEEFHESQTKHFNRFLKRLSGYADMIYIDAHEKIRHLVEVDTSIFNLVLTSGKYN